MSCTNLDETLFDRLGAGNFYKTNDEIQTGLAKAYRSMRDANRWRYIWVLQEMTTHHGTVPVRSNGGWVGWQPFTLHAWTPNEDIIRQNWQAEFKTVGVCNSLIENMQIASQTVQGLDPVIAEVKAIRAYSYLILCDLYGAVPLVTIARVDASNPPKNTSRQDVFTFIENELIDAIKVLPSKKDVNDDYYGRFTKETAQGVLAKLYLNAEVYTGTARWEDCITQCDAVINSNAYSLTNTVAENFAIQNQNSTENMLIGACNNDALVEGNVDMIYSLDPLHQLVYGLASAPYGGTCVLEEHYDEFDDLDLRKTFFLAGPQYYKDGRPLLDPKTGVQLNLIPITNLYNAPANAGIRINKYEPDPLVQGANARNDYVFLRYADILLMKAECLFRTGHNSEAQIIVNNVRARNFVTPQPFINMTLEDILEERSREFSFESNYRTDLIRFGKFLSDTHHLKPNPDAPSASHLLVFPIPQIEINANPNLKQNPGY